jgi:hypothetical protein
VKSEYSIIIDSLRPQCVSRNFKSEDCIITTNFLCVGARKTEKTGFPSLFRYEGWYRFFDAESVGKVETLRAGISDPVASDDQARLRLIDKAVNEVLIQPCQEYASEVGAIPHHLCIITSHESLANKIQAQFCPVILEFADSIP